MITKPIKQWGIPPLPEYLELNEILAIIACCKRERDRLVLETLWESGARVSEVLGLIPEWIGENTLILRNLKRKGEKKDDTKEVVVSEELCSQLRNFIGRNSIALGTPVFRGNTSRTQYKQLRADYIWRLVKGISEKISLRRGRKKVKANIKAEVRMDIILHGLIYSDIPVLCTF